MARTLTLEEFDARHAPTPRTLTLDEFEAREAVPAGPRRKPEIRRLHPGEFIQNPDGSRSTERSLTVTEKAINQGRPTNIPSIYSIGGEFGEYPQGQAVRFALATGEQFSSFDTIDEAETAARARSDAGGRFADRAPHSRTFEPFPETVLGPTQPFAPPPEVAAAPNLPRPGEPESTAFETFIETFRSVPDMAKQSIGGFMQALPSMAPPPDPSTLLIAPKAFEAAKESFDAAQRGEQGEIGKWAGRIANEAADSLAANHPNVDPESLKGYAFDIGQNVLRMVPAVGVSFATGSPGLGLSIMGLDVYGRSFNEARRDGRTPAEANLDAMFNTLAETIPERIPLGILMKSGGSFVPRVLKTMGAEAVQEDITEALQIGYDLKVLDKDVTWGEALQRMKRAGIVGAGVGGGLAVATAPFVPTGPPDASGPPTRVEPYLEPRTAGPDTILELTESATPTPRPAPPPAPSAGPVSQTLQGAVPPATDPTAVSPARPQVLPEGAYPAPSAEPSMAFVEHAIREPGGTPTAPGVPAERAEPFQPRTLTLEEFDAREAVAEAPEAEVASVETAPATIPGQPAPAAVVPASPTPNGTQKVITTRGNEIEVQYELVEADNLIVSHTDDLSKNPAYPQEIQPRQRDRAASAQQIAKIAGNLRPELLGVSPKAGGGAPIVGSDGVVESGNGRVLAVVRAYRQGFEGAQRYRDWLVDQGYDQAADMREPVLIRRRITEMTMAERARFAREANTGTTLGMSAGEQAAADAADMPAGLLDQYQGGNVAAADNRGFVTRFAKAIVPEGEQARFFTGEGQLSQEGRSRIENAIFATAYGRPELLSTLREDLDNNIRGIGNALIQAAPAWAQMRAAASSGQIPATLDITQDVLEVIDRVGRARTEGVNPQAAMAQIDAFAGEVTPAQQAIFGWFYEGRRPRAWAKVATDLEKYATEAAKATTGPNLLGLADVTPEQLIATVGSQGVVGAPNLASVAGEAGGALPTSAKSNSLVGSQAEPLKTSMRPDPSGISTPRTRAPSTTEGTINTDIKPPSLGDIDPASNHVIIQTFSNPEEGLKQAAQLKDGYVKDLQQVAKDTGATFVRARVKKPGMLQAKVTKKRPANTISDYLGAQLLIEDPAMLGLVLEDVRAKWRVLEEENFLETPKAGYRAVHLQVEIAPGFTAELQLVPETIGAVQEKTHLIYNKWKRVTEFTPAQMKVFKRDMAKMNKIFANAWLKSPFNLLQSVLKPKSVDAKAAARLRKGADSMQKQIDAKRESGVVRQRSTNRRERMADSARQDADRLADIQTKMRALADGHEVGTLPEVLQGITSRAMVEGLRPDKFPWKAPKTWPKSARDDQNLKITRMKKAGIRGQRDFNKAKKALDDLANFEPSAEQRQERESQELRREVAGIKIPGFFETPPAVAAHMVEVAEIEPGMSVLEPSAGAGAIARQIRDQAPEADLDVIEFNPTLAEILKKQDFAVDNADFLEHKGAYDRIIMNPPFEKHQDVEHVKHAFSLLKPGGRLVSIMSPTHASEPRFRDWTEGKLESVEGLASGTFQQTGVASKIITLFKELALDETGAVRFPGAQGQPDTIDLTDQGEQRVIPGAERSTAADAKKALKAEDDRKKLEIQTRQTKMGRTGQQGVDEQEGGLFSTDEARGQGGLFDDTTDLHAGVHLPSLKKQWHRAAEEIIDWLATGRYSPFANRFLKGYPWRDPTMADLEQRSEYLDMRQILQGTIGRVERVARRLNKVLRKASAEDQAMAYEYLTTRGVDPSSLPARIRGATVTAKSSIKKLGRQLVREGMISQESYEALADTYLPRVYLKHLLEHTDFGVGLKASDMGYTNPRIEDLPEEYKEYLGEIKDVPFLVTKALSLPARDMAILHFLRDLTQNPAWVLQQSLVEWTAPGMQTARKVTPYWLKAQAIAFRRRIRSMPATEQERLGAIADDMDRIADEGLVERGAAPKDFREMPNSPRYGDLRGLVVRKEIYDDIVGKGGILIGEKGAYDKTFDKLAAFNAFWKKMKVPFNPPTQVRNFVSNGVLLDISGVPFEKLPILYARAFSEIIRGMAAEQPVGSKIRAKIGKQGKHYRIAVRRGIRASTFTSAELRNIEPDILRVRAGQGGPMEKIYKMGEIMARLSEKPGDIYQLSETLGKMVKIIDVMEREGGSEAEAVAAANEALFDYSLVPNLVKSLRTRAIGAPFITFYYKAFPAVLKGAIKHPGKMAKYYILPYVLGDMLLASLKDVDEDDVEKLREALPQWMQDQGHVYIYPYKDASGRWAFVNYGYFLPWSMHERTVRNAMEVAGGEYEGSVNDFMSELGILGGPVPQIISAMMTGVDPFSGREIIKDTDPPKEQIYKLLNYAWRMGGPSWLTDQGVVGHMQRSLTQTPNYYGDAPMSPEQAAGRMVGINIYPTDPVQSRQRNIRRKVYEIDRTRRDAKRSLKNRSLDAEKKADLRQQYRGQIKQLMDDLKRYRAVSQVHPRLR